MNRRLARENAFCLIFEREYQSDIPAEEFFLQETENWDFGQDPYIKNVFFGTDEKQSELDSLIAKYAIGWKNNRLSKVSLAIMRLCIYEMLYLDDVPGPSAINEAIELAKKYDYDSASSFINGILNAVYKASILEAKGE